MAFYEDIIQDQGITRCDLCDEKLLDNDNCIEEHIKDQQHINLLVKRLMIQNSIMVNDKSACCRICNIKIAGSDIKQHIETAKHQRILEEIQNLIKNDGSYLELPMKLTTNKDKATLVMCYICDRFMDFTRETIEDHIHSPRHKRARAITVQAFNGIFSVEGSNDDLWCKFCQVYFENYIEIIFEHIENPQHATKLSKILRLINGESISVDKFLTDPKDYEAYCLKCRKGVACNLDNLERHIKGKAHTNS